MSFNNQTHIELYSSELNGWIELKLRQFSNLLTPFMNSYAEDEEFDIDACGLNYKLGNSTARIEEALTFDMIREGDYYEIEREAMLSVKLSKWYNGGLRVNSLDKDIAEYIEEWQDKERFKIISGKFKLHSRGKVILKNEETNEVIISFNDGESTETVSIYKIRLLSEGFEKDHSLSSISQTNSLINSISTNIYTNSLRLKKISIQTLVTKIQQDEQELDSLTQADLINILSDQLFDLENVFFDLKEENHTYINSNSSEVIFISTSLNLLYVSHLLLIKLKKFLDSQKIQREIQKAKEKIENVNKIIETRQKKIFKFSSKFSTSVLKLAENLNKEHYSFVSNQNGEFFEFIIYENGKGGDLKKIEKEFNLKEDFIRVDAKIADWIKSKENKEELARMMKTSKIVGIFL